MDLLLDETESIAKSRNQLLDLVLDPRTIADWHGGELLSDSPRFLFRLLLEGSKLSGVQILDVSLWQVVRSGAH